MKKISYILLIIVIIFGSCSVKKRSYRKGYYIDWAFKSNNNKANFEIKKNETIISKKYLNTVNNTTELASNNQFLNEKIIEKKFKFLILNDTACNDIINLRNGSIVKAKVIEVNENVVKYKYCNYLDGPLITVNKNDIYSIKYSNGNTDHFIKSTEIISNKSVSNDRGFKGAKQIHPEVDLTLLWTVLILALGIFALIPALIHANRAKKAILNEPNKYTGLDTVTICQTICYVILGLTVLLFILILFALGIFVI